MSGKERVQVLYLLKTQKAKTIKEFAELIDRNRGTVQEWLAKYRSGGLEELVLYHFSKVMTDLVDHSKTKFLSQSGIDLSGVSHDY